MSDVDRALEQFDAQAFVDRHGGYKESRNPLSKEYLLTCLCGSERLRWRHEPGLKMAWVCWGGCGRSGDTLALISMFEGISREDAIGIVMDGYEGGDAVQILTDTIALKKPSRTHLERLPTMQYPDGFEPLHWGSAYHELGWRYLEGRGVLHEMALEFSLGFARKGRLKNYVIFPVFMDGGLVYYQARAAWDAPAHLDKAGRKAWEKATRYRKTLNPSSEESVGASSILMNYDRAAVEPHVVIVEGPIDAVKVGPNAVALLGKALSEAKIERLLRMRAHRYTIYLDRGQEELEVAYRLGEILNDRAPTYIATPPEGYDAGALSRAQNARVLAGSIPFRSRGLVSQVRVR